MPVYRYLDLSTGHLIEKEANELVGGHCAPFAFTDLKHPPRVVAHDYGAWVNVPTLGGAWSEEDVSAFEKSRPGFAACFARARELGCNWINFDQDADQDDVLPTYEW